MRGLLAGDLLVGVVSTSVSQAPLIYKFMIKVY